MDSSDFHCVKDLKSVKNFLAGPSERVINSTICSALSMSQRWGRTHAVTLELLPLGFLLIVNASPWTEALSVFLASGSRGHPVPARFASARGPPQVVSPVRHGEERLPMGGPKNTKPGRAQRW